MNPDGHSENTSAQRRSKTRRAGCIFGDNAARKNRNIFLLMWQKLCFHQRMFIHILKDCIRKCWHPMILPFPHFVSDALLLLSCSLQPSLTKPLPPFFWQNYTLRGRVLSFKISWRKKHIIQLNFLFSFRFEKHLFQIFWTNSWKQQLWAMSNICIKKARGIKGWLKVHRVVQVLLFSFFDFSCSQMLHLAAREAQNNLFFSAFLFHIRSLVKKYFSGSS